jgi:hypothetical protein
MWFALSVVAATSQGIPRIPLRSIRATASR